MADEFKKEDAPGAPGVTAAATVSRRGFVAQIVVGATILVAPSVVTAAPPGDAEALQKGKEDPAPSKSSWNFPAPSRSSDIVPSRSPIPRPSTSPLPSPTSPPRSASRPSGNDTPAPVQPSPTRDKYFDFFG